MSKVRYAAQDIKHINLFESMTGATVKDFLTELGFICFVVSEGDMGLAIGKKGTKVEKVRTALGKQVIVFEFNPDPEQFIRNMFFPVEIHGLEIARTSDDTTAIVQISRADKSRAIGQGGVRINLIKKLIKRHHNIENLNIRAV